MDNNNKNKNTPGSRILLVTVLIATGLFIGLWIWKSVQISNIRKQSATEMQLLKEQVTTQIRQSEELHLKALAKPFVWAVRSEMLKNNISQVNLYINEMVKEKNFQKVVVTNEKKVAILSTNKKDEGKEFILTGKANYLWADTTSVENINDSLLVMTSPIMGFNNRLGTLVVIYNSQLPKIK